MSKQVYNRAYNNIYDVYKYYNILCVRTYADVFKKKFNLKLVKL